MAKLLNEKGFDEPTTFVWYEHLPKENAVHREDVGKPKMDYFYLDETSERNFKFHNFAPIPPYINGKVYSAPTHQMACDWLREVHHICITIYPDKEKGFEAVFYDIESDVEITLQSFGIYGFHIFGNSYEEAVEAALKYSFENMNNIW